jgi:hypothetical protein
MSFLTGSPSRNENVSTLLKEQNPVLQQLIRALQGQGAGGAFGSAADYYRSLLSDDPAVLQQFFAPEQRKFQEQIIPGLSEQFAGMGAGGLSSSGFRNSITNAGTDLAERLGAIRAGLKQQGAAGLSGLGQIGLGNYSQPVETQQGSQGFLGSFGSGIGNAVGQGVGGYLTGGPVGGTAGAVSGFLSGFGKKSPYGGQLKRPAF